MRIELDAPPAAPSGRTRCASTRSTRSATRARSTPRTRRRSRITGTTRRATSRRGRRATSRASASTRRCGASSAPGTRSPPARSARATPTAAAGSHALFTCRPWRKRGVGAALLRRRVRALLGALASAASGSASTPRATPARSGSTSAPGWRPRLGWVMYETALGRGSEASSRSSARPSARDNRRRVDSRVARAADDPVIAPHDARSARCWAASGEASQNSSIFVASLWSSLREIAHISTGSSPSLRCERGVRGATRTTEPARTASDVVAGAEGQRPARDDVELLDLVVVVAGALLEVRVRRDADQRDRELLGLRARRSGAGTRPGRRCRRSASSTSSALTIL